jgi:hypothetical protein
MVSLMDRNQTWMDIASRNPELPFANMDSLVVTNGQLYARFCTKIPPLKIIGECKDGRIWFNEDPTKNPAIVKILNEDPTKNPAIAKILLD